MDSWFLKYHWFKLGFCSLEPKLNHLQPLRHWTFKKVWKFIWVHWHSQVTWEPATYLTSGRSRPSDKGAPGLKKKIFWLFFRPHFRLKMGWGGGGESRPPSPSPGSATVNLVWVTKLSFVSKALIIIHRKKKDKSLRTDLPTMYLHWLWLTHYGPLLFFNPGTCFMEIRQKTSQFRWSTSFYSKTSITLTFGWLSCV